MNKYKVVVQVPGSRIKYEGLFNHPINAALDALMRFGAASRITVSIV